MSSDDERRTPPWRSARRLITPNPLLALAFSAVICLFFAVFVFGEHGSAPSADIAELLRTVSVGSLAAGVTTIVDRSISLKDLDQRLQWSVRQAAGVAASLTTLGVYTAHDRMDFAGVFREAAKGETVSWLDTYCPLQNEFTDDLVAALTRGVHVRMLVIDPACDNAKFRNAELQGTVVETGGAWEAGLLAFAKKMEAIAAQGYGRFDIRYYADLPCAPMYLIGTDVTVRKGYFSLFLVRATAHCPHIELRHGELLRDMGSYFDRKWAANDGRRTAAQPA
jgi:hypothetical protein